MGTISKKFGLKHPVLGNYWKVRLSKTRKKRERKKKKKTLDPANRRNDPEGPKGKAGLWPLPASTRG